MPIAMNRTTQPSAIATRFTPANETRALRGARESSG